MPAVQYAQTMDLALRAAESMLVMTVLFAAAPVLASTLLAMGTIPLVGARLG
jgi:hypothetical protein